MLDEEKKELQRLKERPRPLGDYDRDRLRLLVHIERESFRNEYGPLYSWLMHLLWRYDFEGLTKCECPYDEYYLEVKNILPELKRMYKNGRVERREVDNLLRKVFDQMFRATSNGHYPANHFSAAAQEICEWLEGKSVEVSLHTMKMDKFLR